MSKSQIKWWSRPFIVFTILLFIKMSVSHSIIFKTVTDFKVVFTALPIIMAILLLLELLMRKHKLLGYMLVNLVISCILFITMMYNKYYGVIVTHHALQQMGQVGEVKSSIMDVLDPMYFFVFADLIVLVLVLLFSSKLRKWGLPRLQFKRSITLIGFVAAIALLVTNMVMHKDIVNEFKKAEEMGTLNYQVYRIVKDTILPQGKSETITQQDILDVKNVQLPDSPEKYGVAAGKNLIIIQLESFQNLLLNEKVGDQEITPVLNDLMKQSYYFPNFYQQIGQGNTSDAEYLINTSLYPSPDGAASQTYSDKALPSLPKIMHDNNYQSLTFHANDVSFWNRNQLYPALGFDHYYDKSFFGDEDVISFAASDEVLYKKTAEELKRLHDEDQKFYAHVISLTNHHPFELPASKNPIQLPAEYDNTLVGNYYRTAHYTDYALGLFIDQLKESGVWDDSIVVIYGDHFGLPLNSLSDHEKEMLSDRVGKEYSKADMFNIPLIISIPGVTDGTVYEQLGGQVDVMPTIANLMGISLKDHIYFGQDLFNNQDNLLPERYYLPTGSFLTTGSMFVPGKDFADGENTKLKPDSTIPSNQKMEVDYAKALKLLQMSDDYVKSLPAR
ncbi:LTA synthase family protein [Paenibacillus albiflavus]|uniref:LTA synthase family protein n=1 Tax=Paenibacillus albiflavus TaxID=2545760 RepID=A0A4R4EJE4_9BACL|nr:LTA synthase family protein [Paenibacillus albiflavus]TCZ80079.1 LTA synthase family protein [Paenibacillus albiflavus]